MLILKESILDRLEDDDLVYNYWNNPAGKETSRKYYLITKQGFQDLKEVTKNLYCNKETFYWQSYTIALENKERRQNIKKLDLPKQLVQEFRFSKKFSIKMAIYNDNNRHFTMCMYCLFDKPTIRHFLYTFHKVRKIRYFWYVYKTTD